MTQTSNQVAESTQDTLTTAGELAQAAERQSRQVNAAAVGDEMARSIAAVSRTRPLGRCGAAFGDHRHRRRAGGPRNHQRHGCHPRADPGNVKRIKRLGESSQGSGAIVELINDISEQTNILARTPPSEPPGR